MVSINSDQWLSAAAFDRELWIKLYKRYLKGMGPLDKRNGGRTSNRFIRHNYANGKYERNKI
jgi:hypothetical protein